MQGTIRDGAYISNNVLTASTSRSTGISVATLATNLDSNAGILLDADPGDYLGADVNNHNPGSNRKSWACMAKWASDSNRAILANNGRTIRQALMWKLDTDSGDYIFTNDWLNTTTNSAWDLGTTQTYRNSNIPNVLAKMAAAIIQKYAILGDTTGVGDTYGNAACTYFYSAVDNGYITVNEALQKTYTKSSDPSNTSYAQDSNLSSLTSAITSYTKLTLTSTDSQTKTLSSSEDETTFGPITYTYNGGTISSLTIKGYRNSSWETLTISYKLQVKVNGTWTTKSLATMPTTSSRQEYENNIKHRRYNRL